MEKDFKSPIIETLSPMAVKEADSRGLHLLRIDVRGTAQTPVIEVVIDGPRAISIEDCEVISHALKSEIELTASVKGNFRIDVLSPGIEEPIIHEWQFVKNRGRIVEAHYADHGESHTVHGVLKEFTESIVEIEPIDHAKRREAAAVPKHLHLEGDEQVYKQEVEMVVLDRSKITKMQAVPQIR